MSNDKNYGGGFVVGGERIGQDGWRMDLKIEHVKGFAELARFRRDPTAYVGDVAERGVDIRHISIGSRQLYLVNNPEMVRDVLITNDWNFIKGRGLRSSKPLLGDGLLTSEGEVHRRQRRLAQPGFHRDRLALYAKDMVSCAAGARDAWRDGGEYVVDREMNRLTLQIVGRSLFSADIAHEAHDVGEALTEALHTFNQLNSPAAQFITPLRKMIVKRSLATRERLDGVLQRIIKEHRAHPERYDDMLSMLMGAEDENSATYMSDDLVRDEAMTLFLAGHETTANALTWTWYLLSENSGVWEKMREELARELEGRLPTLDDMPRLRFTERVFREALRLYPPAWIITREAVTGYQLGPLEVRAGSTVFLCPFATQRDGRYWNEPKAFDPERWTEEAVAARRKFTFFPFGAGMRVCIGEHFAMMEGVLVLATIAQRWRLELLPGQEIKLWPQITLRPRDPMRFKVSAI
jgi:cytochrome P450